jgi:hypothetical protein
MKKMIIPRRDHEVYFLPLPENTKEKQILPFVIEQMDRLHPCFSTTCDLDVQLLFFNEEPWIMVTVMKEDTLAEYEILNKNTAFYTNTSIAVHNKSFVQNGINAIDDEYIGYDTENMKPVSVPLESSKTGVTSKSSIELKALPVKQGVFCKRVPKWQIMTLTLSAIVIGLFCSTFFMSNQSIVVVAEEKALYWEIPVKQEEEDLYMPSSIEILARISADLVKAGGKIIRWQYNEDKIPLMTIQLQGITVMTALEICHPLDYLYLEDIGDVRYIDGEPHITLYLNAIRPQYSILAVKPFPDQNLTIPMITELTDILRKKEILIVSEVLPSPSNSNLYYTITYTAKDRSFIRSLEIIADTCSKYQLWVKGMDVSISSDNNLFTVVCTLSSRDTPKPSIVLLSDNEKIPAAFGYKDIRPIIAKVIEPAIKEPDQPKLGSIRDRNGSNIFFRDTSNGKIQVRINYE